MRVAMIDPSLFTLPYDQALAGALVAEGHTVTLYGRRPEPEDSNPPGGLPITPAFYRLAASRPVAALPDRLRLVLKGLDHVWSAVRLWRRLRRERPDVIHVQWLPLPLADQPVLKLMRRIAPLVLTVHDTNPFNGNPTSRLQTGGFVACLQQFDRLVVHTQQGAARLRAQAIAAERLAVLPHGIIGVPAPAPDAAARGPVPIDPDPMAGAMTFVLFGKIKPYKGADVLIEAFARLPSELRAQARVRIVGKPYMDLAPLHVLARARGVAAQVTIEPHFVADDDIAALFGPGTVAVFPYREIDASGVLPIALAHARPVVASRLGTFGETLIDGIHGHLAAPDDIAAFAAALGHLAEDRDFARDCSRAALKLSDERVGWDAIARRTAAVYAAAADQWRDHRRG